jgi:hypothetical protein
MRTRDSRTHAKEHHSQEHQGAQGIKTTNTSMSTNTHLIDGGVAGSDGVVVSIHRGERHDSNQLQLPEHHVHLGLTQIAEGVHP